ncbi:uncharacterized protein PF11_0213 [Cephus cinctus]|uniref:non-specific serine/threonine protein kinase n=1 Tax=Cephus cinctus TaxID=211228 RepID=A0AAJ7C251_CEPCN|nr:uncharacterized protein PF11_0213 [Cephus cinctus]
MSNLPIRTYQRKNAAKQTSILYKNPTIISRTNTQLKSSKNYNIKVKEKLKNVDDTLDYDPFDTTFDRLAKDARLPPVPPISGGTHDSWYDSSDNSLPVHNSSTISVAQDLIRTKNKASVKVVKKGKRIKDSMMVMVNKVTRNKYPKPVRKTRQKNGLAMLSVNETDICLEKDFKVKRKYNHKKKNNNIIKVEESKKDVKHVFSQNSNHSSNNSSVIDHKLIIESVSGNNPSKVAKIDLQSSNTSEITKATNMEEVPSKRKKAAWKMKIVLSPNKKKIFQERKRKSKSKGNSSNLHSSNDVHIKKQRKLKSIDNNVPAVQDNQNQTSINHLVNRPEVNSSFSVSNISMNSLNDASDQIDNTDVNSSSNNINNISMDSSKRESMDLLKLSNSINLLAHSTPYSNSKKSSNNKPMDPLETLTNVKASAHCTLYSTSKESLNNKLINPLKQFTDIKSIAPSTLYAPNKNSNNKPMDSLEPSTSIKAVSRSTSYPNSSNSVEVTKPMIIVKPCCVKLERYEKNKTKQNYLKEYDKKEICIPDFSHLPAENITYEHVETTRNNLSQSIIRSCSVKISRNDVDKFLKSTSIIQEINPLQLDSRNCTNQLNIKECSVNLSRIRLSEYKKIKLWESNLPMQNYHGLMCSTPLEGPVKQSLRKVRFSPINSLTSIKTKRQKIQVKDKRISKELSKEKTNDVQDINTIKKNLHSYYNTSDVEESKGTRGIIEVSQECLSMDEQTTVELEPKSNKIKSNSFVRLASDQSEDSIYAASTVNYNSFARTNLCKKVLGVSSDSDASCSLFSNRTTNEENLTSSNDDTKNKTDVFCSKAQITKRRNKNNKQLKSDILAVNTRASQESSNTENISFEDSSLFPTKIIENSQEIDTDTSTSNLLEHNKVNSISKIDDSNESLSDISSQETTAQSLSMDSEYSKKSQENLEHCDNIKKKETVSKESEKSKKSEKQHTHVHFDNSLLSNNLEKMDVDNVNDSTPLTKRLRNSTIAKLRSHQNYGYQLTLTSESAFRGIPKEVSTNALQNTHLSLVDVSSKILENSENLNVSADNFNEKTSVFLKPGKLWARSLSILNNIQKDADLDALSVNKGKKWRQSVQAILAMQQRTPRKSSISGNTGLIQSCINTNDNDKEPETHHKIRPSVNRLSSSQVNTTFGSTSPGRHIRRISIRVVPDNKKFSHIKHSPFLEAYGLTASKNKKSYSQLSTQIAPLKETAVYNVQHKNAAIETFETGPVFTAREVVLQRCNQDDYIQFEECFPKSYLERCRKIGEGVYGEVFIHEGEKENSVIKIIPIEGRELVNGEIQKKFSEILSEIVIARELYNLRFNDKYNSNSFVEVKNIRCIIGKYPEKLVELWKIYDEEKNSDNDCPLMFNDNQLYIVLELGHGGQDLEAFVFQNASQSHALFIQTAFALAVAEKSLEFEHRDLHWGNILISHTDEKEVHYKLNDKKVSFKTKGVQAAIIDFTLSRMSYQGCCIFNDLALDPALFAAQGEYQFEIYRLMRDKVNNNWQKFEPFTNLLWLHYTLDKMITAVRYKNKKTKVHKNAISELQQLKDVVLNYNSAFDFVTNCEQVSRLQCSN